MILSSDQEFQGVINITLFDFLLHEKEILMKPEENPFAYTSIV